MRKRLLFTMLGGVIVLLSACTPEVGSEKWCAAMKDRPAGEWTGNEAADYTRYCVLNMEKEQ